MQETSIKSKINIMPFYLKSSKYQDHLLWLMKSHIEQQHHHLFNIWFFFMIIKSSPIFSQHPHINPSWVSLTAGIPCSSCATSPPLAINEAKAFGGPLDLQAGLQRRSCSKGSSQRLQTKGAGNGWDGIFWRGTTKFICGLDECFWNYWSWDIGLEG